MPNNFQLIRMCGEFTRPNNTTTYSSGKIVADSTSAGTLLTLTETLPAGNQSYGIVASGTYMIKSVDLVKSSSGTTNATFDVFLYSSGVTALNDGANFVMTYANKNVRIGKTNISMYTGDTNSTAAEGINTDVDHTFVATGPNLFARIVTTAAYTPVANESFFLKVLLVRIT